MKKKKRQNLAVYASVGRDKDGYLLHLTREAPLRYRIPERLAGGFCALTGHQLERLWLWHSFITKVGVFEMNHEERIHTERIDDALAGAIDPEYTAWDEYMAWEKGD